MDMEVKKYIERKMVWKKTPDAEYPYSVMIEGEQWLIRLNDFPEEHLYTLLTNGVAVAEFDDWPATWLKAEGKILTASAEAMA